MANETKAKKSDRPEYTADFYKQDNDRGVFMGSPMNDNLFTALLTLTAEVWVNRRRLWIMTSLMEKHGKVTEEMIEQYVPTEQEEEKWKQKRDAMVSLMYDPFLRRKDIPYTSSLVTDQTPRG